jgi:hypothetical protein
LKELLSGGFRMRWVGCLLLVLLVVESLPSELPSVRIVIPGYVKFLAGLPAGAVVDAAEPSAAMALNYQTIYDKPMLLGFVARLTPEMHRRTQMIKSLVENREFELLSRDYLVRYLIVPTHEDQRLSWYRRARAFHRPGWPVLKLKDVGQSPNARQLFEDGHAAVYLLGEPCSPDMSELTRFGTDPVSCGGISRYNQGRPFARIQERREEDAKNGKATEGRKARSEKRSRVSILHRQIG